MGKSRRRRTGRHWGRLGVSKTEHWECKDYKRAFTNLARRRLVDRDILSEFPDLSLLLDGTGNYRLPKWGRIDEDFPIYFKPLFKERQKRIAELVLEKFQIPHDIANLHSILPEISDEDGGENKVRGSLETLDLPRMPAINALQLSCAEVLQDEKILECYINPSLGKAEFFYIDWNNEEIREKSILDVRYILPADQYNPKYDLVVVTGFDPPAYRWFYSDWFSIIGGGPAQVTCPERELGSCGGTDIADCGNNNQFANQAFVTYSPIRLIGDVFNEFDELIELYPGDSFVGFLWSIYYDESSTHTVSHTNTVPFIKYIGQSIYGDGSTHVYYGPGDGNFNECGFLKNPDIGAFLARDIYIDGNGASEFMGGIRGYVGNEFLSRKGYPSEAGFWSYDYETDSWVGDIESVQFIWMGNRISSIEIIGNPEVGRELEWYDILGRNFIAEQEMGIFPVSNLVLEINDQRSNALYGVNGVVAPTTAQVINRLFTLGSSKTGFSYGLSGDNIINVSSEGEKLSTGGHFPWRLAGAEGDWGGFVCSYWAIVNRSRPAFLIQGPNACEVASSLRVRVLPVIQTDPPSPKGICGGEWTPGGGFVRNEWSCLGDTDPNTTEEFTDSECYKLEEASNGKVFETELPFLDCEGVSTVACFLYEVNNKRYDSVTFVCGPNSDPKLGSYYESPDKSYGGVVNSIEYSYTDSSSYTINVTTGPAHWEGGASNSFFELETDTITRQGEVIQDAANGFQYVVRVPRIGDVIAYQLVQDFGSFVDIDVGDIVTVEIHNIPKWRFRGKF